MPSPFPTRRLRGLTRSMLYPLYERALETRKENGIINDPKAVEIVDHLSYDLSDYRSTWLKQLIFAVKTEYIDQRVTAFLTAHPNATIINIGAGLDTRLHRIDNGTLQWIDLDLPEVIEVRRFFFPDSARHHTIARSMLDFTWFQQLPPLNDRALLIIIEGVLPYYPEPTVQKLLRRLGDRFPGSEIIFDTLHPILIEQFGGETAAEDLKKYHWSIEHRAEIEKLDGRLELIEEKAIFELHPHKWRQIEFYALYIPKLRKSIRVFQYRCVAR